MKTYSSFFPVFLLILFSYASFAQPLEFGDAPEATLAYPASGVIGQFPTCKTIGVGFIQHNNFGAILGPAFDMEMDGNAGLCPGFAPYDNDECWADGDAGLLFPEPFTIVNGQVVTCPSSNGTALGPTCSLANWGAAIDISVTNNMPNQTPGLMNVVIDFNQNGIWGDIVNCPGGPVPEHVLVNFVVPWGFTGPLSALVPPGFTIGPNAGYVWARFTISEQPVAINWDGHGSFEDGETEDYLLEVDTLVIVDEFEYGDAPDGKIAYPLTSVIGNFPTCMNVPASGYIQHMNFGAVLGPIVDFENEGNAGICPLFTPYDNDECFNDGDAGLMLPDAWTIQGGQVVTCPNSTGASTLGTCALAIWGTDIDIMVQNFMPNQTIGYFNLLFDWNMNGVWGDITPCPGGPVPEHAVVNYIIPNGYSGPLSGLMPPSFVAGPTGGHVWARFTISEAPVPVNWDGHGVFEDGETEDYLLYVNVIPGTGNDRGEVEKIQLEIFPNPASSGCNVSFILPDRARISVTVMSMTGEELRKLADGWLDPGRKTINWSGLQDDGTRVAPGLYIVRLEVNGSPAAYGKVLVARK